MINFRHANPYELLEQIIDLESNFKQGKKCAKLGVLLAVSETPGNFSQVIFPNYRV